MLFIFHVRSCQFNVSQFCTRRIVFWARNGNAAVTDSPSLDQFLMGSSWWERITGKMESSFTSFWDITDTSQNSLRGFPQKFRTRNSHASLSIYKHKSIGFCFFLFFCLPEFLHIEFLTLCCPFSLHRDQITIRTGQWMQTVAFLFLTAKLPGNRSSLALLIA